MTSPSRSIQYTAWHADVRAQAEMVAPLAAAPELRVVEAARLVAHERQEGA